jgi:hypothetical protein
MLLRDEALAGQVREALKNVQQATAELSLPSGQCHDLGFELVADPAKSVARDFEEPGAKQSVIPNLPGLAVNREHHFLR